MSLESENRRKPRHDDDESISKGAYNPPPKDEDLEPEYTPGPDDTDREDDDSAKTTEQGSTAADAECDE